MPEPRKYHSNAQRQAAYRRRVETARQQERLRKGLPASAPISSMPGHRRWQAALKEAVSLVETVCQEMRDYYDARSEAWQESDRAEEFTERLEAIEAVLEQLGEHAAW
jgi:hypothetical protein